MGQKFEFDEATAEQLAARVPLPEELARELVFDLRRWLPPSAPFGGAAAGQGGVAPGPQGQVSSDSSEGR